MTKSASVDNLHSLYIFLSPLYPRVFPLLQGTCKMTRGGHSLLQISAEVDTRFISYQITGYFHLIGNVLDTGPKAVSEESL